MIALVVVDMIRDNMSQKLIGLEEIIPRIKKLIEVAREKKVPVIYAIDSFLPFDPFFEYMSKHAIRCTEGIEVVKDLKPMLIPEGGDFIVEKRWFSAFFKTDLDLTLRGLGIDTVAICGINTWACVLFTAVDAVSNDFKAIIIEDCCTSHKKEIHDSIINIYQNFPGIKVRRSEEVIEIF